MIICMSFTANSESGEYKNSHHHFQTFSFDGDTLFASNTGNSPGSRTKTTNRGEFTPSRTMDHNTREDTTYDETISIVQPYTVVYFWRRTK